MPACDMYTLQGDAFSQVVRGEMALPYGVEDAILNMRVIDALFKQVTAAAGKTSEAQIKRAEECTPSALANLRRGTDQPDVTLSRAWLSRRH